MAKPTIPQGTRDFSADVVRKRNYIFTTIKDVFEIYGFQPLETPAMENLDTLMGKYGEEGDKLIFKILNNGLDNPEKETAVRGGFDKILAGKMTPAITERALKYDLTIPFARYVAMNHTKLTFPFRRYQVQPVWRADRPQKGRYREFFQCDADIVGSTSLFNEVELISIYSTVFSKLKISTTIKINNRKVLQGLAEVAGNSDKMQDITTAIDKLDKIGIEKVKDELKTRGLSDTQLSTIEKYLEFVPGDNKSILSKLKELLSSSAIGKDGINELEFVLENCHENNIDVTIDPTLARGLNYYTGSIIEVKAENVSMGSIGGGGRYDDLTGLFGVPGIPGVGISFGVDRIYDVMDELQLFPADVHTGTEVLFLNLGEAESKTAFKFLMQCRANGIRSEIYHEASKIDKQFKYAEKKNIPFVVIIGEKELTEQKARVKNLATRVQEDVSFDDLSNYSFK